MGEMWPCKFQSLYTVSKSEKEIHVKQTSLCDTFKPLGSAHVTALGDPFTSLCKLHLLL